MQDRTGKVCAEVLKEITPSKKRRDEIEAVAKKLEVGVVSACKKQGIKAKVRVEGSVAKDTWLTDEPDVDVFMRVSAKIPHGSLGKVCLKVAREATEGSKQVERFAEHPYLEAYVDSVRVNIVPCYDVKLGDWHSATDRTPYHTDYIRKCLSKQLQDDVRLLKKFMKGIGVYGAEIKVGGFSGYLCELLVLHYGGFVDVLKTFAQHRQRIVVDIEGYYSGRENEIDLLFKEPLVVVDPVDKGRNVASAVQAQKLHNFVAATRSFLNKPDKRYFYPPETVTLSPKEFKEKLAKRGPVIVAVAFDKVETVPDILWGQLYKSQRSLRKLVELSDFHVLRDTTWSDEKAVSMFIFELEDYCIPLVKKHLGPPLDKEHECGDFLAKHMNKLGTVAGPYIEDGRWVVQVRRKYTDVCVLLREKLKDGGKDAGVAEGIAQKLRRGFKVLINEGIAEAYGKNGEFSAFLTEFLSGKPKWLEAVEA